MVRDRNVKRMVKKESINLDIEETKATKQAGAS